MRRSLLILVTTVLVLSGAAVWAALIWRAPRQAEREATATAPLTTEPSTVPATTSGIVVVVPDRPAAGAPSSTRPYGSTPPEAHLVPEGDVGLAGYREVAHVTPNCTVVVTKVANRGTAPVGSVSVEFDVETGYVDATGARYWRSPQAFGRLVRDGLDLAPGADTDVDWEICLTSFEAATQAVRAAPVPGSLDWTWRL